MAVPKSVEKRIERIENLLHQERGKLIWILRPGDPEPEPGELMPQDIVIKLGFNHKVF